MFEKEKKYFPIKTATACQLKWSWSTVWLNVGETASCHRCFKIPLTEANFKDFHNLPHKIKEREIMLSGKWPTLENGGSGHCTYCKKIEDAGGTSDRIQHLSIPNAYPTELDVDNKKTTVIPKILEVFLDNTCNLKCTYCATNYSSKIESEIQKFGDMRDLQGNGLYRFKKQIQTSKSHIFLPLLIKWLEKNGKHLYRINFLGGETFYQKELDTILEVIKKIKNKNLVINIVSNLMVKEDVVKKYIEKIENMLKDRQVGGLDILASIDGWGPEAEYARHGLECEKWLKLFNYLCSKRWMRIGTQQTITSLTIKSVPELINVIKKYQDKRIIEMHISLVEKRPWMHPSVFGRNFWREDFEKILNMLPKKTTRENILKNYMEGIYKSLPDQQPDLKQVAELKHFLNQLDQRRNTNWREIYPYLDI